MPAFDCWPAIGVGSSSSSGGSDCNSRSSTPWSFRGAICTLLIRAQMGSRSRR